MVVRKEKKHTLAHKIFYFIFSQHSLHVKHTKNVDPNAIKIMQNHISDKRPVYLRSSTNFNIHSISFEPIPIIIFPFLNKRMVNLLEKEFKSNSFLQNQFVVRLELSYLYTAN